MNLYEIVILMGQVEVVLTYPGDTLLEAIYRCREDMEKTETGTECEIVRVAKI